MSEGKRGSHMNRAAVICFAIAAAGIPLGIYLIFTEPPATAFGYVYLFAALPTTQVGVWGGIGAMQGS
jgi:hypothetical protein